MSNYINKIDDLIDKIINDFYNYLTEQKIINDILNEQNFVKYQKDINNLINVYVTGIKNDIRTLIIGEDNVNVVYNIVKKYLFYYIFMYIGFFYEEKDDIYMSNIVEFSKNQTQYGEKIINFFNTESNSISIKFYTMIKKIITLLNASAEVRKNLSSNESFKSPIDFLNEKIGSGNIQKYLLIDNKNEQAHNLIKYIIIYNLYEIFDRKQVFSILEENDQMQGEYIFIEISVPIGTTLDLYSIENIIPETTGEKQIAYDIIKIINTFTKPKKILSINKKISELFNSKLIVPLPYDFLLYHKRSEKYESIYSSSKKKTGLTKLRYIVNKIEKATDLNENNFDERINLFNQNLSSKRAILINEYDDLDILTKTERSGKFATSTLDEFMSLLNYRKYPFINFKIIKDYGFPYICNKNIEVIRSVSFEKEGFFKQQSSDKLQTRMCNEKIDIVGLFFGNKNILLNDAIDIQEKFDNGFNGFLNLLIENNFGINYQYPFYWIFNKDKDITSFEYYDRIEENDDYNNLKLMIAKLYDKVIDFLFNFIVEKIISLTKISFADLIYIKHIIKNLIIKLPKNDDRYKKINIELFNKLKQIIPSYDKKEDIFYGIDGDIIKLPYFTESGKELIPLIKIIKQELVTKKYVELDEEINAICQHNIQWEEVIASKKKSITQYDNAMRDFLQQYVIENNEQNYICKSCGSLLNIKKYIIDGTFDNKNQKFVTYGMPLNIALEDVTEYSKYNNAIKNIDKIIEKIASLIGLQFLSGSVPSVRNNRKLVTKNTIDIVLANNKIFETIFKERNELITRKYNIDRNYSNFFVFKLENNLFVYSSKEKDFYKPIKFNNIIAYCAITILSEITESNINNIKGNPKGVCNYQYFEKLNIKLFDHAKIIINRDNEIAEINKYPVLCYIIYMISCMITRYGLWYTEITSKEKPLQQKKKIFDINIQKSIIQTIIDVLNSILEITQDSGKTKYHIYEILSTKFYNNIISFYVNKKLIERETKETHIKKVKITYDNIKNIMINITGIYNDMKLDYNIYQKNKMPRLNINILEELKFPYQISNITNCITGQFHHWVSTNGDLLCDICGISYNEINHKNDEKIKQNLRYNKLYTNLKRYCSLGIIDKFNLKENICENTDVIDKSKLNIFNDALIEYKSNKFDIIKNKEIIFPKEEEQKNKYDFINSFITQIEEDAGLSAEYYDTRYILIYDYKGTKFKEPIVLSKDEFKIKKIKFEKNNKIIETESLYYVSKITAKINVYYDILSLMMLGYQEENKNFVINEDIDNKLVLIFSLYDKIKYLGYSSKYIQINDVGEIKNIIYNRIKNLRNFVYDIKYILGKIKYHFEISDDMYELSNNDKLINNYRNILFDITIPDDFFDKWEKIISNVFIIIKNKEINPSIIDIIDIDDIYNNNLLNYIIEQFINLINFNSGTIKTNIINILKDYINNKHNEYMEIQFETLDIKKFMIYIKTDESKFELEKIIIENNHDLGFEKTEEEIEEEMDAVEENEAIDMEKPMDFQRQYDELYSNFEPTYNVPKEKIKLNKELEFKRNYEFSY